MISGSIAAYKTCFVISKLVQRGHEVQVVTTPQALNFIGPSTLEGLSGKPVLSNTFESQHAMDHIHLARWADLILLCPATANTLNKMAQGIADDLVTNLFLAHDFTKPFIVAPAMNTYMYQHPCTQNSIERLKTMGLKILEPGVGSLACGEVGSGRLMEPEDILSELDRIINKLKLKSTLSETKKSVLADKSVPVDITVRPKILITSGGTQEPIDAMRVLTNLSTGQTGALLAEIFWDHGYEVHYLGANHSIKPQRPCTIHAFTSFDDLNTKLKHLLQTKPFVAIIHAAAVSDFHVSKISSAKNQYQDSSLKIPSNEKITIELEPNFKILPLLKSYAQKFPQISTHQVKNRTNLQPKNKTSHKSKRSNLPVVVGFKFTSTQKSKERVKAVEKIFNEGGVDIVIHNDRHDIDKTKGLHPFTFFTKKQKISIPNPLALADTLIEFLSQVQNNKKGSNL